MTDVFLLAIVVSVGLYISSPVLFRILFPTYTASESSLAVSYFRIMVWGMCFYMSNQLLQSLLNAEKDYAFSSLAAMMNNVILTAVVFLFGHQFGLPAMAVAVPVSYIVQYVFLQVKSRYYGRVTLKYGLRDSRITRLCIQTLPIFWGNAFSEINQLVDQESLICYGGWNGNGGFLCECIVSVCFQHDRNSYDDDYLYRTGRVFCCGKDTGRH